MGQSKNKKVSNVKVALRVRPMLNKEKLEKCEECVYVEKTVSQVVIGNKRGFSYDYTFDTRDTQEGIYEKVAQPLVETIFEGYNATIFAYGQTGSGKTYTMGTANMTEQTKDEELGIIPRVIRDIFTKIEQAEEEYHFEVRVSYLEIYNEKLKDLLSPSKKNLVIREDENKGITVIGLKEEKVEHYNDMIEALETGAIYRTVGSTQMNQQSSRSHSIFTIYLEKKPKRNTQEESTLSKFHLVDLAGSERNKKTKTTGIRLQEAIRINCGLLALGNVISALGDERKRSTVKHVPYRDSKLTRLLQDSLGGNANTIMVACVSPANSNFEETLNTLKYAHRTRNIKNKPIVNKDKRTVQEVSMMKNQIEALQAKLDGQQQTQLQTDEYNMLKQQNKALAKENEKMLDEVQKEKATNEEYVETLFKLEGERNTFRRIIDESGMTMKDIMKNTLQLHKQATPHLDKQHNSMFNETIGRMRETITRLQDTAMKTIVNLPNLKKKTTKSQLQPQQFNIQVEGPIESVKQAEDIIDKQQHYIANLEEELKEVKVDLYRDEQIFSDKVKEINKLKIANKELQRQSQTTQEEQDELLNQINELQAALEKAKVVPIEDDSSQKELEEEMKQLRMENEQLEKERNYLESQVHREKEEYDEEQDKQHQNLKNLNVMIRLKEELIRDLVKSTNENKVLQDQYERRINSMEREVEETQQELARALRETETAHEVNEQRKLEKHKIKSSYKQRIKKLTTQLQTLKKKQHASQDIIKMKHASNRRIVQLEDEVNRMREKQTDLKYRMKIEEERLEERQKEKLKQLKLLQREQNKSHRRIRTLEKENQRQRVILKKRNNQLAKYQQKLKEYQTPSNDDPQREWIQQETEKYMKRKEMMDKLEKQLQRRTEMLDKREGILTKKELMQTKSTNVKHSLAGLNRRIKQLEDEISSPLNTPNKLKTLEAKRSWAVNQKMELEKKASLHNYDEQLRNIDDATEILDAEIEYNADEVTRTRRLLLHAGGEPIINRFDHLDDMIEARSLLSKYFEKVIEMKEIEKEQSQTIEVMRESIKEHKKMVTDMNNNMRVVIDRYEEHMKKMQKDHQFDLIRLKRDLKKRYQTPGSNEPGDSTNRRSVMRIKTLDERNAVLEKDNQRLRQENHNLRTYLPNVGNVEFVRKSIKNMKEIPKPNHRRVQSAIGSRKMENPRPTSTTGGRLTSRLFEDSIHDQDDSKSLYEHGIMRRKQQRIQSARSRHPHQ